MFGKGVYVSIGKGVKLSKQWFMMWVWLVVVTGIFLSSYFFQYNNGNFLICNVIGFLGVLQYKVEYDGADINVVEIELIVVFFDFNFCLIDLEIGSDGVLYIFDWCNFFIGYMQHNMCDFNCDHLYGCVYCVIVKGCDFFLFVKI